jgi:hypothetical protein
MRRTLALLLVWSAFAAPAAHAARNKTNQLLRVVTPVPRGSTPAHPFVNVVVRFSPTSDGFVPDPSTFRARLSHTDVTDRFHPVVENGAVVGMRGTVEQPLVRISRRPVNRLRFEVRSLPRTSGPAPHVVRDIDRLRFRAVEAANQPPVAAFVPPGEVIFPDIALQFDGTPSQDPELDEITYAWDFGDGGTSTDAAPAHVFAGNGGDVTVRLTVSDGSLTATDQETLVECPQPDAGRTAGLLRVESSDALEFGAIGPAASAPRMFTISNPDPVETSPTSQLKVRIRVDGPAFAVSPDTVDLGPGASAPVTLTFAPTAVGHQSADIVLVASGSNRCVVHLVAHGYGGTAPGSGPTLAAEPVFFNGFGSGTALITPAGARVPVDNHVYSCQNPAGPGTGDLCIDDGDCAANGGTCNREFSALFDPVDMCSDGAGGLYLMSDDGTFTDPVGSDNQRDVSILRINLDDSGTRTGAAIIARETEGTTQLACDGLAPGAGGHVFTPEFRNVNPPDCFRSEQEALVSLRKGNGASDVLLPRIDAAEGLDACDDDVDQVADLNVSADGIDVFASLEDGGLYQIRPAFRLIVPDIRDVFQLHPDGNIVYVTAVNPTGSTTGLLNVYKISPEQAANGVLGLAELTPCATFKVPNNRGAPNGLGRVGPASEHFFAVGRASLDSLDAVLLVSFASSGGVLTTEPNTPLSPKLRVQGTVAFAMPAGVPSCNVLGLVTLDVFDELTF